MCPPVRKICCASYIFFRSCHLKNIEYVFSRVISSVILIMKFNSKIVPGLYQKIVNDNLGMPDFFVLLATKLTFKNRELEVKLFNLEDLNLYKDYWHIDSYIEKNFEKLFLKIK